MLSYVTCIILPMYLHISRSHSALNQWLHDSSCPFRSLNKFRPSASWSKRLLNGQHDGLRQGRSTKRVAILFEVRNAVLRVSCETLAIPFAARLISTTSVSEAIPVATVHIATKSKSGAFAAAFGHVRTACKSSAV